MAHRCRWAAASGGGGGGGRGEGGGGREMESGRKSDGARVMQRLLWLLLLWYDAWHDVSDSCWSSQQSSGSQWVGKELGLLHVAKETRS